MRITLSLLSLAAAGQMLAVEPVPLRLVPAPGSTVNLYVAKTGLMKGKRHHFTFSQYEGVVDHEPPRVTFTIDARTIQCLDTWVSPADLKKIRALAYDKMLAADRFPAIAFRSTDVRQLAPDRLDVRGDLTIRGITTPAVVSVTVVSDRTFSGKAIVKMTAFGLQPPSAALGLVGTKDEMELSFTLRALEPR